MSVHDVEARLRRAAEGLPELPDRLAEVRRRGRRRRLASRTGAAVGAAAALVLGLAIVLPPGDRAPAPIVDEPEPRPTASPTPTPSQAPTAEGAPHDASPTMEPLDDLQRVGPADLGWAVVTVEADGVRLWRDGEAALVAQEPFGRLAWLPGNGVVGQRGPGDPIVLLGSEPGGSELVTARDDLLLRAAGIGPDGQELLLVTWTQPAAELGPDIVLGAMDVGRGRLEELGVVGNREDGPDGMAVDDEGIVWATCHLQCTLATLPLPGGGGERRRIAPADWRAGVAVAGDTVATVAFTFDPEEGRPSAARLALHHRGTGDVLREIPLAGADSWDVDLSLSADGSAALVTLGAPGGADVRVYVVDGLAGEPRVRLLEGTRGAVFADE